MSVLANAIEGVVSKWQICLTPVLSRDLAAETKHIFSAAWGCPRLAPRQSQGEV